MKLHLMDFDIKYNQNMGSDCSCKKIPFKIVLCICFTQVLFGNLHILMISFDFFLDFIFLNCCFLN